MLRLARRNVDEVLARRRCEVMRIFGIGFIVMFDWISLVLHYTVRGAI